MRALITEETAWKFRDDWVVQYIWDLPVQQKADYYVIVNRVREGSSWRAQYLLVNTVLVRLDASRLILCSNNKDPLYSSSETPAILKEIHSNLYGTGDVEIRPTPYRAGEWERAVLHTWAGLQRSPALAGRLFRTNVIPIKQK